MKYHLIEAWCNVVQLLVGYFAWLSAKEVSFISCGLPYKHIETAEVL